MWDLQVINVLMHFCVLRIEVYVISSIYRVYFTSTIVNQSRLVMLLAIDNFLRQLITHSSYAVI